MHAMQVLAATAGAQVVPARAQMATTLGFHIILACFGIAFPTIVLVTEYRGLRRRPARAAIVLPTVLRVRNSTGPARAGPEQLPRALRHVQPSASPVFHPVG